MGERYEMRICQRCGKEYSARVRKDRPSAYCSKGCMWEAQIKRPFVTCMQCGREFRQGRNTMGMYCSSECQWASMKKSHESERGYESALRWMESLSKRMASEEKTLIAVGCQQCGKGFLTVSRKARFCSGRCYKRYQNRLKDRRVWKNGVPDGSITLEKLFVRDGGRCRNCGLLMTFECDPLGDSYPSIDHIVPIARGGLHSWDNVQLLCRGCNSIKRDSTIPAMAEPAWF